MKVFCYRNLKFRDKVMWSIKDVKTGRVIMREPAVVVMDAELKVSLAGNRRVRQEKRKNVHAGIKGELGGPGDLPGYDSTFKKITYNPYKHKTFVIEKNGKPVTKADLVILSPYGVWAKNAK